MIRYSLLLVLAILFVDVMGEGLVYPVTPSLLQILSHGTPQTAAQLYGVSLSLYAALTLFFAPVWGLLSDCLGRKPLLVFSMAGAALGNLLTALAPSLEVYFLGRAIAGLTSANLVVINAYIIDISPPKQRAGVFGLMGAVLGAGFVVGPALGGLVAHQGLRAPFWVVTGLSLLTFCVGMVFLPESLRPEHRQKSLRWKEAHPFGTLAVLARYPLLRSLAWSVLLNGLALQMLIAVWVPHASYRYGFGPGETGLTLAAFGLMSVIGQGLLVPYLVPRLGEVRSILIGLSVSVVSYLLYGLAGAVWVLAVAMVINSLGAIDEPALQSLISQKVSSSEQGTVQGALATLNNLMGIVGPVLGTYLFGLFTGPAAMAHLPGATFFACAFCALLALLLTQRSLRSLFT